MEDGDRGSYNSPLPTRSRPAPEVIQQRQYDERNASRGIEVNRPSWAGTQPIRPALGVERNPWPSNTHDRHTQNSSRSSPISADSYEYANNHNNTVFRHDTNVPLAPHQYQRHPSQTQSQPVLPIITPTNKRPPRPSLRATLLAGSSFYVPRVDTAPPILPVATIPKSQLHHVVSGNYPSVDWRKLPLSVFETILTQLRHLHTNRHSTSCTTCLMRDISSLSRTCRKWYPLSQRHLYTTIHITGSDSPSKLKRFATPHGARLILLRRTLRAKPAIAALVHHLRVPDPIIPLYLPSSNHPNPQYDNYISLLASLIMTVPNLRTFTNFNPFYNHTFDRLTHAISTRRHLRQHVWVIAENAAVSHRAKTQVSPGLLDSEQTYQFDSYHERWKGLETLMLCSPARHGVIEHDLFTSILSPHRLPALKHLCISSFDKADFNDATLLSLPEQLTSLRLEELPGVTDAGLARWAMSPVSCRVERLTLLHLRLINLIAISKLLAGLELLRKFTFVQPDTVMGLPDGMVVFQPLFAGKRVEWLHWDVGGDEEDEGRRGRDRGGREMAEEGGETSITPNTHLALSILHQGFPSLTRLRAPRDTAPLGMLQSVCRPPPANGRFVLERDRLVMAREGSSGGSGGNSLQAARIRAQILANEAKTDADAKTESRENTTDPSNSNGSSSYSSYQTAASTGTTKLSPDSSSGVTTRYIIPEDWDKEVIVAKGDGNSGNGPQCRCKPIAVSNEERCRCHDDEDGKRMFLNELDKVTRVSALRKMRNRRAVDANAERALPEVGVPMVEGLRDGNGSSNTSLASSGNTAPAPHHPRRNPPQRPKLQTQTHHAFSLPTGIGKVSIHISSNGQVFQPPVFHLLPDVEGRDGNGGVVGWGELLRIEERRRVGFAENDDEGEWIEDGCDGSWNTRVGNGSVSRDIGSNGSAKSSRLELVKSRSRSRGESRESERMEQRWRHTVRERDRGRRDVRVENFF